ncbi:DUF1453 domain-containing protein [Streptomyces sp. MST-110588]|uniref:DUF1453 domain-containing protein n=1 Tax=Streptomyces sp. MST-110588 TaxID=2833628 RepID=UPI001F5D719D|nr:DUF1453 domain-containing protein [Streptomyces sp. MST-110588]UNO39566.1 DUF1453 domain-containing protein [Streptomyces sp. MST-110588]
MNGVPDVLVIVAVVAIVLVQQFRPQKLSLDRKSWWVLPAVLAFMALRKPDLLDPAHRTASVALLAVGVITALLTGAVWAWTTRIWTDRDGVTWCQGRAVTFAVWAGGIALRLGLYGVATALGVHQGSPATMVTMAAMLLARTGVLTWRAQGDQATYRVPAGR